MRLKNVFLPLGVLLLGVVLYACVDPPTSAPPIPEPRHTLARFAHVALDAQGVTPEIKVDGNTVGTAAFGQATNYVDFVYGSRYVGVASVNKIVNFGPEQQGTVLIYSVGGANNYLYLGEGDRYRNNSSATKAKVKFVNAAIGSLSTIAFKDSSVTGATVADNVPFVSTPAYQEINPGSRSIYVLSGGGYKSTSISAAPGVVTRSQGSGTVDLAANGGLSYNVSLQRENKGGFYTAGHIHYRATGNPIATVNVSAQDMSFRSATLSGAQEVPPVTTTSTGTATVSLSNSGGVTYSVSVTSDNTQGFYTQAHFHNAPAGQNGPVVKAIVVKKQTISFPSTTLSGSEEVPPVTSITATGTGTFTLFPDSLQYSIVVTRDQFDTTFTMAHFHAGAFGANGPVVRSISDTAWSTSPKTFTGTWKRTDSRPLTDSLINEIRNGRVYVNFHSVGRPGGIIRAQLRPNATTTNTFAGTWNDSTLTSALKDQFAYGNIYLNFHTVANPGGQIRAQLTPVDSTVNTFSATLASGTIPDSLRSKFNDQQMYFVFHTTLAPAGQIRGDIVVDSTKGIYGVSSLAPSSFDAGKMYTVVAVGSGTNLRLIKFEDRLGSAAKPANAPPPQAVKPKAAVTD